MMVFLKWAHGSHARLLAFVAVTHTVGPIGWGVVYGWPGFWSVWAFLIICPLAMRYGPDVYWAWQRVKYEESRRVA
jgi:hypothetical protein